MSTVKAIDRQISNYLMHLNPKQKKAVLNVVKTFAEEQHDQEIGLWKNVGFVVEMDKRIADLESGKVVGQNWESVKQHAKESIKWKKKK